MFCHHFSRPTFRKITYLILGLIFIVSLVITPKYQFVAAATPTPTPPPPPELLAPFDNTVTTADNYSPLGIPEVSWKPVAGATKYRVQFSPTIGFSSPVALEITTPYTRYTPINTSATLFYDHEWYWRVRVESPVASDYSAPWRFDKQWAPGSKPALVLPEGGAQLDFFESTTFSWNPVTGAAYYRYQTAADASFTSLLDNVRTLSTTYQPPLKRANGVYYWRVVPYDAGDHAGTPSDPRQFNMSYGMSPFTNEIPVLIDPANGSTQTFTPAFHWTAVRGASKYQLQYTTDPSCNFGNAGATLTVDTANTAYTPLLTYQNDVNVCWHVRAYSGVSISDWSPTWSFFKRWYTQPRLLTPTNGYQAVFTPYFSWTPVPGAAKYRIEVNFANSFPPGGESNCRYSHITGNTHFIDTTTPVCTPTPGTEYFWRVIPVDGSNHDGRSSVIYSFRGGSLSPQLISPLYFYTLPIGADPDFDNFNPHEDRTVAQPIFQWSRVLNGSLQMAAYRVEVNQGNPFLDPPEWTQETENLNAVPTLGNPFTPVSADTDYYWRVCPLTGLGGGSAGPCSDIWKTRFNPALAIPASPAITLLRPLYGYEFAETFPLLEWAPLSGADHYDLEISKDPAFAPGATVDTASMKYTAYTPSQRSSLPYGTYYWRVIGRRADNSAIGAWSQTWRFEVAAQSGWRESRTAHLITTNQPVAYDPAGDAGANFDLTNLYSAQTGGIYESNWYFGFQVPSASANTAYVLYIDLDHVDNSGATSDANNYSVTTTPAHRPEYAIYVNPNGASFLANDVWIYPNSGSGWGNPTILGNIGGSVYYSDTVHYVELRIPDTQIGMGDETGSASLSLFSVDKSSGQVQDTVPQVGLSVLDRFTLVSGRLTLITPANNITGDPTIFPSVPPFEFQLPVDVPWFGYNIQIGTDPLLTNWLYDVIVYNSSSIFPDYVHPADLQGDNTYYWRVRPLYYHDPVPNHFIRGAWSNVGRFEREGFKPTNMQVSITFGTPTFSWDRVEGAATYEIQIDTDPGFSNPQPGKTAMTSYTPITSLGNGTYYWRVLVNRYSTSGEIDNDWFSASPFTLNLPTPANLTPDDPAHANPERSVPTLCWTPLIVSSNSVPVLAAWKYRVQVSQDTNFSTIYDTVDTEQPCWTPTKGYADSTYYWHVAMIDGGGKLGQYSPAAQFFKQYPTTTQISPTNGQPFPGEPKFIWTQVNGAAKYRLEISTNFMFTSLYEGPILTVNTQYTPVKDYINGTIYYYRIAIVDADGKIGPYTGEIVLDKKIFLPIIKKK